MGLAGSFPLRLLVENAYLVSKSAAQIPEVVSPNRAAATEASEQACNNNDTGADTFLNSLTWPFPPPAQTAEPWMNAGSEALLIGNALKKSAQLLTLALRQRCAE